MSPYSYMPPAWQTPIDRANRVELVELPGQAPPDVGWPESFWAQVGKRKLLVGEEAEHVIRLFRELVADDSARCHIPPWGLAFYDGEVLLFTVSLCFQCSNAYVYSADGVNLRAFDVKARRAKSLRAVLKRAFPERSD